MMVFLLFHCDSIGLAAARTDVRAFSWQMMPALKMRRILTEIKRAFAFPFLLRELEDFVYDQARKCESFMDLVTLYLCDGESLLFHDFVKHGAGGLVHFVEFVDAANT